jgi:hypothetical protein
MLIIMMQLSLAFNSNNKIMEQEKYSIIADRVFAQIHSGRSFFLHSRLFEKYLTADLRMNHVLQYYINPDAQSDADVNIDTVSVRRYDVFIVERALDKTENKQPIIENEYYSIYK